MHRNYEAYVETLMQRHRLEPSCGYEAMAFETNERARAQSLLETLKNANGRIRRGIKPELLEEERKARRRLDAVLNKQVQLQTGAHSAETLAQIESERYQAAEQYDVLRERIRQANPGYAALTEVQGISLKRVQQILDQNTLMLEFSLGETRSYLWAITRETIEAHELPPRAEIEEAARRFYQILTAPRIDHGKIFEKRDSVAEAAEEKYQKEAANLGRMLLGKLRPENIKNRLLIIPDGALHSIPFQVLIAPTGWASESLDHRVRSEKSSGQLPLAFRYEIVYEPSAAALVLLENEIAQRKIAPLMIAVLADPIFDIEDPRIHPSISSRAATRGGASSTDAGSNAVFLGGTDKISRLLFSGEEGEFILNLFPARSALSAIGFDATREAAVSSALTKYRIIHFATHAFIDNERPELSGIAMSLLNQRADPVDGVLRLYDIYNLDLPAELVVLSACNTGVGKEIRGEGLISLTRGFMYAGAARVVASLWKVEDEASAALMKNFYQAMINDGLQPAAALRKAQISVWEQKRWRSPYYWAGFILQGRYGEELPLFRAASTSLNLSILMLLITAVGLAAGFFQIRRWINARASTKR
jgi:CHAT domain-containing protein